MQPTTLGNLASPSTGTAQRVVPLLQAISRLEENVAALAIRLDPVTNHVPTQDSNAYPVSPIKHPWRYVAISLRQHRTLN